MILVAVVFLVIGPIVLHYAFEEVAKYPSRVQLFVDPHIARSPRPYLAAVLLVGAFKIVTVLSFATVAILLLSRILSLRRVGNILRIASLFLIAIGFHFDLLGS